MFKLSDYFIKCEGEPVDPGAPVTTKTYTEEEVAELVAGLKTNNDRLLAEKKEAKRLADEDAEARRLADVEAQKKSGDLAGLEASLRSEFELQNSVKDAKLNKMQERILGSERRGLMSDVITKGQFADGSADILQQFIKVEFDGDDIAGKFVGADGNVITTDVNKFVEWCGKHPVLSKLMAATAATGGGAGGSKGGGGATNFAQMNDAERIELHKTNPAEFDRQMKLLRGIK